MTRPIAGYVSETVPDTEQDTVFGISGMIPRQAEWRGDEEGSSILEMQGKERKCSGR